MPFLVKIIPFHAHKTANNAHETAKNRHLAVLPFVKISNKQFQNHRLLKTVNKPILVKKLPFHAHKTVEIARNRPKSPEIAT